MSNYSETGMPRPEGTANLPRRKTNEEASNTLTYVMATILCFFLAFFVFIIAKPEEKTGPPQQEQQAQSAMLPQGHPDTASAAVVTQIEERVATLREAEKAHADDPALQLELANALYDLANAKRNTETFGEALESYQKYLALNPNDLDARTDMAFTLFRTGKIDEAIAELYKVQAVNPKHQNSAFNLAVMYKEKNQPDSVLAYIERTAAIDSTTKAGRNAQEVINSYRNAH